MRQALLVVSTAMFALHACGTSAPSPSGGRAGDPREGGAFDASSPEPARIDDAGPPSVDRERGPDGPNAMGDGSLDAGPSPERLRDAEASRDATTGAPSLDPCARRETDTPPRAAAFPMKLAGQDAWIHDERSPAGYFHTYDALSVGTGAFAPPRKVHVFLPRSYVSACKRYPVVYMNDGDTAFFTGSVGKSWDMQGVLASAYEAGSFGEIIVVAVHPLERDREYTHTRWLTGRACCDLPGYAAYLAASVKPFVDGAYRTRPGAEDTIVLGSSHGGLAAFFLAATRAEVFGKAVAMSPSFWVGLDDGGGPTIGGPLASSALLQAAGGALRNRRPRLYLDWGLVRSGGVHNALIEERVTVRGREMRDLLASSYGYAPGVSLFTVEDPQGEHDENSWRRRVGAALALALKP